MSSTVQLLDYEFRLTPIDWSGVSGMADILMVIINLLLLATVWQGIRNIRETRKSRDAEMMNLVLEQIQAIKPAMRELHHLPKPIDWANNQEAQANANQVSIGLQRIGYLGASGLINKKHLIEMWGPTFVAQWNLIGPFVQDLRKKTANPNISRMVLFPEKTLNALRQ